MRIQDVALGFRAPSAATTGLLTLLLMPVVALSSPALVQIEEPYGIALEGFAYPYPVRTLPLSHEGERLRMAYMDVRPDGDGNGRTVVLLHGRNFPSSYWEGAIKTLTQAGYRVIVPDQIGFGKSSKPAFDLHFDDLARQTMTLLDELGVEKADVIGHSMGGMLGVRFARTYPERVERIVLAAPIGLEDYRLYVPPAPLERLIDTEAKVTPETFKRQLMTAYAPTLTEEAIDPYVQARTRIRDSAEYPRWLRSFASSAQMIWREPVVQEIPLLPQPVLFIMGENDHLAPGRDAAPESVRAQMGQNTKRAQDLAAKMKNARVEVLQGIGHLVHVEAPRRFNDAVTRFLSEGR